MRHRSVWLWAVTLGVALAGPARARAETVLFACSESCPLSLFEALELELRGHGGLLVARLSPSGFSVEAHESDARRVAGLVPAAAVVWIEREPPLRVRVLSPTQSVVREAPLTASPEEIDPRVFAAIAGSVVLNVISAPGHGDFVNSASIAEGSSALALPAASAAVEVRAGSVGASRSSAASTAQRRPRSQRFFLRAGAALGIVPIKSGMRADRAPPLNLVNEAYTTQLQQNSAEAGKEYLADHGYSCNWSSVAQTDKYIAKNCGVTMRARGIAFAPAIDIQAGAYLTQRFALSAFLRIANDAGLGTLNHTLFGVQAELVLSAQEPTGFWANVGLGSGVGRLQLRPDRNRKQYPYVTSGPFEAHALVALGYRFLPYFGVYAAPTVRVLFPDPLWMIEPTLGVEARL